MKLFDLSPIERRAVVQFVLWHIGFILYAAFFAFIIYHFNLFKAYWFLSEFWILNLISPLQTLLFVLISPYRRDWLRAIKNMYRALDGDRIYCTMAFLVLVLGFYLYNILLWGLGGLVPSIIYT